MKNKKIPDVRPAPKSASTVPLSFKEKFFFGIGPIGKNLSAGIVASNFLTLYFMGTLGLSPAFFAVLFFVGRIWDGVNDLMMGTVIDHTKSKLGKFRPWIIIGTLTNALVAVMIYSPPNTSQFWLYFFVTVMYILHDASYTMVDVGYWALIPALSLEAKEREQLSLIPRLVGAIGGLIGGYSLTFVNKLGGNERGFFWVSLIFAGVYMLTMLSTGAMVKERVLHVQPVQEKFSLIRGAKILFANDQALTIVVIMTFFNVACTLTVSVVMFYFTHVLENDDGFGHYNIIIGAARGLGLLGFAPLSRMFGRDRISKIAYLAPCLGYALFMIFSYTGVEGAMPIYIAGAVT
ncbi:MAG: MFS transporter, partial [Oscillospiraceae bacterium]|nr:MFS transporter [Oscillospiraceae bacterium]